MKRLDGVSICLVGLLGSLASGCSKEPTKPPADTTGPAAVANLITTTKTASSIALAWTATGDDGAVGTATSYDIRYSTSTITSGNFDAATPVSGEPSPAVAGTAQAMTISGLAAGTTYYFAMRVSDEVPNLSGLSNAASGATLAAGDGTAPAAVANLLTTTTTASSITLTWTAPGDDGAVGTAASYDIRYSTSVITNGNFAAATAVSGEPSPGPAGTAESMTVFGLAVGTTYYFAMKTADEVPNVSGLSNVASGITEFPPDVTPPAAVADLITTTATTSSIDLTWTAPGDDGVAGVATSYDIRYSTSAITDGNFAAATPALGEPSPGPADTDQAMTVSGLAAGTTYYFAMKTWDEVNNVSGLSNIASGATLVTPDATPPAAVADLTTTTTTSTSITLTWTAPGDDGLVGMAASYDLRYSTSPITNGNFAAATPVSGEPAPATAGTAESVTVPRLAAATIYYFALKTSDEVPNVSGLSNVASGATLVAADATPPAAVADLLTTTTTTSSITLTWSAPGDDGAIGTAASYDIRYSTSTITNGNFAAATPVSGEPSPAVAGSAESMTVSGLAVGTTYYFAMKTADEVPNVSGLSNVASGATLVAADATPPAAVADLLTTTTTTSSITLTWSAPGDDGAIGTAASYDIRYSTSAITNGNFAAATPVSGEPSPAVAGSAESMTVSGLAVGTTYYFAMKTSDEVPNVSGLSNVASGATLVPPDATPPDAVADLLTTTTTTSSITLTWSAPGDDGAIGTAASYDIRYSTSTITNGNFAAATPVSGEPSPAVAGNAESMTVSGLAVGTTYYFAMKTADEVPNVSGLSNVASGATQVPPDATPPDAVADLLTTTTTTSSITLTWSAPGDDGAIGTAASYDIRYSTSTITEANFAAASAVPGEPNPASAGTDETMTVSGLDPGTTYYFAMKTSDEVPNVSGLSNVASGATQAEADPTPPDAVADLLTDNPTISSIHLTWTAPGDDGAIGTATSYDIRYSLASITGANFDAAIPVSGEPSPAAAGTAQAMTVSGLAEGATYYFAMITVDEVPNVSLLSNVASGATLAPSDPTPPAVVADLVTTTTTSSSITLAWTAPGDDGAVGTATLYDIRYSTLPITSGNFEAAVPVSGSPSPAPGGTAESVTVSGLGAGTNYYFALKASDEVFNVSGLSNVATGATLVAAGSLFSVAQPYATGSGPWTVVTTDFNGDGKLDVATSNYFDGSVSVLLGTGTGTLASKNDFPSGGYPLGLATGTFDNNLSPDLVVTNSFDNTVSVLFGNGSGAFAAPVSHGTGTSPSGVAVGDLHVTGVEDLAVADNSANAVSVLVGDGAGAFASKFDVATGTGPWSVRVADLNGDTFGDLVFTNLNDNTVSVRLGDGSGVGYAARQSFATGSAPLAVSVRDLNADGKPDLITANGTSSSVSVLLGNGDGTFAARTDYATGADPRSVVVADLNGDGKLDVATANHAGNSVSVLLGDGQGALAAKTDYLTAQWSNSVEAGDFNGDGKLDLVVANYGDNSVSLLLNVGSAGVAQGTTRQALRSAQALRR